MTFNKSKLIMFPYQNSTLEPQARTVDLLSRMTVEEKIGQLCKLDSLLETKLNVIKKIPVILDTDIGGDLDDTWALALLLRSPELELKAITTVSFDTAYKADLCAKLVLISGHPAVPVGMGPRKANVSEDHYCQKEWLGDFQRASYPAPFVEDAAELLIQTVRDSARPVTVIGIGVFDNIAEALSRAPDIASKIDFVGLGGSIHIGYFGQKGSCPEYNIIAGIPAARAVLAAPLHSFRLIPLDVCGNIILRGERYRSLLKSQDPLASAVIDNYVKWRAFRLKYHPHDPVCDPRIESSMIADVAAVALAVHPEWVREEEVFLSISDQGETVLDTCAKHPVRAALEWRNQAAFYDFVANRLLNEHSEE